MIDNFTYKENISSNPDPYNLWLIQEGDCNDFTTFAIFVANYHNYTTYQICIHFKGIIAKHVIAVFVENGYLSIVDFSYYFYGFDTFREIVDFNEKYMIPHREWSKYIVYDFCNDIVEKATK